MTRRRSSKSKSQSKSKRARQSDSSANPWPETPKSGQTVAGNSLKIPAKIRSARAAAAWLLAQLLVDEGSISTLLAPLQQRIDENDRAMLQELSYGVARHFFQLEQLASGLLAKPLRNKDKDVHCLVLVGLYQLMHLRVPQHAVINLTVEATNDLGKSWARGMVNGVLRSQQRAMDSVDESELRRGSGVKSLAAEPDIAELGGPSAWARAAKSAGPSAEKQHDRKLKNDSKVAESSAAQNPTVQSPASHGKQELNEAAKYNHPLWMIKKLRSDWPEHWQRVLHEGNQRPPMVLRVNSLQAQISAKDTETKSISAVDYLQRLSDLPALYETDENGQEGELPAAATVHDSVTSALILRRPMPVEQLPGFFEGEVSVQDTSAQLACQLLLPELEDASTPGPNILDACAAPGGKTGHLLELNSAATVTALDISESRLQRVQQNLERLDQSIDATARSSLLVGDATEPEKWWNGEPYDLVLLDAPCSGSGVIRRQPDIKLLRKAAEIPILANLQLKMLDCLWPLVKPGGKLLYVTCSVFREENTLVIDAFSEQQRDVRIVDLADRIAKLARPLPRHDSQLGWQVLTGDAGMDGFYYCLLEKSSHKPATE